MEYLNIGLMGGSFCCPNLGVGALTISQCMILDGIAGELKTKFDVVCYESQITSSLYLDATKFKNLNIVSDIHTYNVPEMRKKLKRHDIVIDMYGGDSFADIYSVKGFIIGASQRIFSLGKSQVYIMAPQTIGPFENKAAYFFAKKVMSRADRIFIRDLDSSKAVDKSNKAKLESVTDMAFMLPFEKSERDVFKVGLNVSGLLWEGNLLGSVRDEYRKTIRSIINYFGDRNIPVVLVPHVVNTNSDSIDGDLTVSRKIAEEFGSRIEIAPEFKNPIEAKSFISGCSFFVGSRMHATIAAVSSGVPSLAIAYSKKFSGVFGALGYQYIIEKSDIKESAVIDKIDSMLKDYDSLKAGLDGIQATKDSKIGQYGNYLTGVIRKKLHENDK